MSLSATQLVNCSACHRPFKVSIWSSVNVTLDAKLKKRLMTRELFRSKCPACGHLMEFDYDLFYHDMRHKSAVWLKHPDVNGVMTMDSLPLQTGQEVFQDYDLRVVTSFPSLLEKIHCIDHDLDDRVMELVKDIAYSKLHGVPPSHDTPFYFAGLRKPLFRDVVLDFVSVNSSGEQYYNLPFSPLYDLASQQFRLLAPQAAPKGKWLHVNAQYLANLDAPQ